MSDVGGEWPDASHDPFLVPGEPSIMEFSERVDSKVYDLEVVQQQISVLRTLIEDLEVKRRRLQLELDHVTNTIE